MPDPPRGSRPGLVTAQEVPLALLIPPGLPFLCCVGLGIILAWLLGCRFLAQRRPCHPQQPQQYHSRHGPDLGRGAFEVLLGDSEVSAPEVEFDPRRMIVFALLAELCP